MTVSPDSRRSTPRALLLAALALLVVVGSVELHAPAQLHGELGEGATVSLGARHAADEAHFESASEAELERCPLCLLRNRSKAEPGPRLAGVQPPLIVGGGPAAGDLPVAIATGRLTPSRAPPLS